MKLTERLKFAQEAFKLSKQANNENPVKLVNKNNYDSIANIFKPFGNVWSKRPDLNFNEFFKGWAAKCVDYRSSAIGMIQNYGVIEGEKDTQIPKIHWLSQ
jgi:hypothetical protein